MGIADNAILTEDQKLLLARFGASDLREVFYLTGGTALSAIYLQHRLSEDLDFFTERDFAIEDVLKFVKSLPGIRDTQYERKYDRRIFLLHYANTRAMKLEFTRYPFFQVEKGPVIEGIHIDSLEDILINKLMAMTDREEPKDFVDLYCAFQDHPTLNLDKLVDATIAKFGVHGVRHILSGRFLRPLPQTGVLSMRRPLDKDEMVRFFSQHAKAWIELSKIDS
jgi:nucleotidyltransferase AbiEii toxin of type IV toxin-antitoxin system